MNDYSATKVLMARIGAAHGVRGEVRVKPFGDDPLSFTDYGILTNKDGTKTFEVEAARVQKNMVVTSFKGIKDRNAAETLNGLELYINRDQLPEPDENEFYYSDLVGLTVVDKTGQKIGQVICVDDFGAGDLIEVRPLRGKSFYAPFTQDFVPVVSLDSRELTLDLPDDYLSSSEEDL